MSAYIVPDFHINALIAWGSEAGVAYFHDQSRREIRGDEIRAAATLYAANVRSVNHRYSESEPEDGFVFKWPNGTAPRLQPIEILKACDCFDYQACEVDDYRDSEAWRIVDAIRGYAIRRLPGYDTARGWSLGDDNQEPAQESRETAHVH